MIKSCEERFKILESEDISTGPENDTYWTTHIDGLHMI